MRTKSIALLCVALLIVAILPASVFASYVKISPEPVQLPSKANIVLGGFPVEILPDNPRTGKYYACYDENGFFEISGIQHDGAEIFYTNDEERGESLKTRPAGSTVQIKPDRNSTDEFTVDESARPWLEEVLKAAKAEKLKLETEE